ncbi:M23 family metallopeptidase [Cohnella caldifontis]|uniref:M23 family metallopeptidase n=1 Tax=Cohnella caldifontis TaxID=3027471 RepID=UPI0023ED8E69|nr:M23 family metallopeptidase [Cohnella sp. YIM B05605]
MEIRENVRRRRRRRIEQLTGETPFGASVNLPLAGDRIPSDRPEGTDKPEPAPKPASVRPVPPETYAFPTDPAMPEPDIDPEKWWKEQQKRLNRAGPSWRGIDSLAPTSVPPGSDAGKRPVSRFAAGFAIRIAISAALLAGAWGWFHSDWPGSREARDWTAEAVSRDMDFQAIEAWYEEHFGGSPSFLPVFRAKGETREVFGEWNRSKAVPPVQGRLVQTFAQDGSGVRVAAAGGSDVKAVSDGRVMHVAAEADGKATIRIQHAGKVVTIYGNVEHPAVRANDWVEAGQKLGNVPAPRDEGGESLLYFAVEQDGKSVDPAEVVPFG